MKNLLLVPALLMAITTSLSAADDHSAWVADYDQAVALAKDSGKDLFVDFTGSDWCSWCKKLDKEVFSHEEFLVPAQENFILVALDFPNGEEAKARVPNPERNQELATRYNISGFPTCLLMNVDGEVLGRMGYQKGGPEKFVATMISARAEGKVQLAALTELQQELANAEDATPVLEKAVAMLAEMDGESLGVSMVADMARQAMALDTGNASGLKLRAIRSLLSSGQVNDQLLDEARTLDSRNEQGLLEQVVKAQFSTVRDDASARAAISAAEQLATLETIHEKALVAGLLGQAAMWSDGPLEDHERAVKLATSALKYRDEIPAELISMLEDMIG